MRKRRTPTRSISRPANGVPSATTSEFSEITRATVPRLRPSDCEIGPRNTLKPKTEIAPVPTISPIRDATTTHHLF